MANREAIYLPVIKLNIGCINKKEGYINVDVRENDIWDHKSKSPVPIDLCADARNLPYKDNEVDEIFTSEMLEHLGRFEYLKALAEWHRVLKPEGKLDLETIDLPAVCRQYLSDVWNRDFIQPIYGGQSFETDFHKSGFSWEILKEDLEKVGFRDLKRIPSFFLKVESIK